jgi:uncharacterized protein YndB with AHSA1/START domain
VSGSSPGSDGPGGVGGPGLLEVEHDAARVVFRRVLRHPIEVVWAAITEPEQVEAWFMARVRREEVPGGALEMDHPNGVRATGRVLAWQPPRLYEYEWNLPAGPNRPTGEASIVRWELSPADQGTLLVLSHRKLSRPTAEVFARGLKVFLDRLAAHLDGTPLPDAPWVPRGANASGTP